MAVNVEADAAPPRAAGPGLVRAAVPWWPVGGAVATALALLLVTADRYGYHRDELYFRMLPPAWGYVDQPPLTPLLARAGIAIFGDTPLGERIPAALCFAASIIVAVLITRELGGGRLAQGLSAWGFGFAMIELLSGHLMITAAPDDLLWAVALLFICRALLRRRPRWWLAAGAVIGIATYNKLLVSMLLIGLLVGLLIAGPYRVLRERHLWLGAAIALVLALPNLIYQATHHWPQVTMAGALADNSVRAQVLPFQLLILGPLVAPVWIAGLVGLLRKRAAWRPVRAIGVAYLVAVVLTIVGGGQIYYAVGLQAFLLAAGWVPVAEWLVGPRWRAILVRIALPLHVATGALLALPLIPLASVGSTPIGAINPTVGDQVGWPDYVRQVAAVYEGLTPADQARAVIVTGNYGEAGSISRFGSSYGLPAAYSAQNELYFEGPPPADRSVVILWTENDRTLQHFDGCEIRATLDNGVDVDNEEQGAHITVCALPADGWAAVWPSLQHYD